MKSQQLPYFACISILYLLSACRAELQKAIDPCATLDFELLEEHQISLPFDFNVGLNLTVQAYTRNDTDFIMMGDIEGSRLVEIDISNYQFSRAIFLDKIAAGRYPVFVNHYLNADSIVVFGGISNEPRLCADSVLYSINLHGQFNGPYSLINSPYRLSGMDRSIPQASFYHHFMPMEVANRRFFVNPLPLFGTIKKDREETIGVHEIGYFDFGDDEQLHYQGIPYFRDRDSTKAYADEQRKSYLHALSSQEILLGHANDPHLIKLDVESGAFIKSQESGRLISDPKPIKKRSSKIPSLNPGSTVFKQILYDKNQKRAFRFAGLGTDLDVKPGDLQSFRDSIIWVGAYDEGLKLIAQGLQPQWFGALPKPAYFKGRFVGVRPSPNPREFSLQFSQIEVQELAPRDWDSLALLFKSLKPKISAGSIHSLYRQYQIPAQSIILTVAHGDCPCCVDYSQRYFLTHLQAMEEQGVYLVITERSASPELKATQSSNIIIDRKNKLEGLLQQSVDNPALMLWNGEKVSQTMVLPPKDVVHLGAFLEHFQSMLKDK